MVSKFGLTRAHGFEPHLLFDLLDYPRASMRSHVRDAVNSMISILNPVERRYPYAVSFYVQVGLVY